MCICFWKLIRLKSLNVPLFQVSKMYMNMLPFPLGRTLHHFPEVLLPFTIYSRPFTENCQTNFRSFNTQCLLFFWGKINFSLTALQKLYPKQSQAAALWHEPFVLAWNFAAKPRKWKTKPENLRLKICICLLPPHTLTHIYVYPGSHKDRLPGGQTNMLKAINKEGHSSSSSAAARLIGKKMWQNCQKLKLKQVAQKEI